MANTHEGFLFIADISGYTLYLSQSELEHAQEILTALLELVLKNTRPPLVVSRLAGDAVISYGLRDHFVSGQTFVEMIENTYVSFRKAIEQMALNNQCRCNACANINSLDLKFFVHFGTFALQHITDHDELVGSAVNLIHRLLKNQVIEKTGFKAYTLYTDTALRQLGLKDLGETLTAHVEAYEHLGETQVWVQDMRPVWEQKSATLRVELPPERVNVQVETVIHLPVERVWDYLIQPEYRKTLMGSLRNEVVGLAHGRIGPGSIYHCYHGKHILPQTIIEWRPFERIVTHDQIPLPYVSLLAEYHLEPVSGGTRLVQALSKSIGPLPMRILSDIVVRRMMKQGAGDIEAFRDRIESDETGRYAAGVA